MVQYLKSRADAAPNFEKTTVDVSGIVKDVIDTIRLDGDKAVRNYSEKFDKWTPQNFKLSRSEIDTAIAACSEQTIKDIMEVQSNVRAFAEAQRNSLQDFEVEIRPGIHLGQKSIPVSTVGA